MLQTDDVEMDGGTLGAHVSMPLIDLTPLSGHETVSSLASKRKQSAEKGIASLQKLFPGC